MYVLASVAPQELHDKAKRLQAGSQVVNLHPDPQLASVFKAFCSEQIILTSRACVALSCGLRLLEHLAVARQP